MHDWPRGCSVKGFFIVTTRTVRLITLAFIGILAGLALAAIILVITMDQPPPPPTLGEAPKFELTNQAGETVTQADVQGRIWVADFIFTRCKTVCPVLTSQMAGLQDWLKKQPGGERVRLVSFSVDPTHDTPKRLRQFGETHGADFDQWHFLTAKSREVMWPIIRNGFNLAVSPNPDNEMMPVNHSARMVLMDREGDIRGYYMGTQDAGLKDLRKDLKALLQAN
jgi:protein SCO1/2